MHCYLIVSITNCWHFKEKILVLRNHKLLRNEGRAISGFWSLARMAQTVWIRKDYCWNLVRIESGSIRDPAGSLLSARIASSSMGRIYLINHPNSLIQLNMGRQIITWILDAVIGYSPSPGLDKDRTVRFELSLENNIWIWSIRRDRWSWPFITIHSLLKTLEPQKRIVIHGTWHPSRVVKPSCHVLVTFKEVCF